MPDPSAWTRAPAYALVLVLAAGAALWGAFLVPLRTPGGGAPLPVSVLLALAVVPLCRQGGRLTGSRWGAAGPGLLWVVLVLLLGLGRAEGDVVLPGDSVVGLLFLVLGTLGASATIGAWRPPGATPAVSSGRSTSRGGAGS